MGMVCTALASSTMLNERLVKKPAHQAQCSAPTVSFILPKQKAKPVSNSPATISINQFILQLMKIHNENQCKDNANQVEWKIKANITIFYLRVHDASLRTHLFCNTRFIRSSGVRIFTPTGHRRRPTLLSRMWSEAQLAVSNGHKHRPRRGRTACWVAPSYGYKVIWYAPKTYNV